MGAQWFLPESEISQTLDEYDIQGDVLVGMQKRAELFVFLQIDDVAGFKAGLTRLLSEITYLHTTRVYEETNAGPAIKSSVSFTIEGLRKLTTLNPAPGLDLSFEMGAEAAAPALGDDVPGDWLPAYRGGKIDGLLLVAAWDQVSDVALADAIAEADRLRGLFVSGFAVHHQETGMVRRTQAGGVKQEGHEHFGFADGVSQPAVKGLHLPVAVKFDNAEPPQRTDQSFPGQDLLEVGEFLLGKYPRKDSDPVDPPQEWMNNGSYLVFRRLNQDVQSFTSYTQANFAPHAGSAEDFAAKIVGRWQDGTPIARNGAPNPTENETHPEKNNDFDFGDEDRDQKACPFASHIRKAYPRGDDDSSEKARIIRAGIAFGADGDADKGLLFLCYQNSIINHFETIQKQWVNSPTFVPANVNPPASPPGLDLLIGQKAVRDANWDTGHVPIAPKFVTATGGAYLFAPSRAGLQHLTV